MTVRDLEPGLRAFVGTRAIVEIADDRMGRLGVFYCRLDAEASPVQDNRHPLPVVARDGGIHVDRAGALFPFGDFATVPAFRVEEAGVAQLGAIIPAFSRAFIR